MPTAAVAARFWGHVDKRGPAECWPWTAYVGDKGYGQFWDGKRLVRAHRFAYLLGRGTDAAGDTDHTCHNGIGCVAGVDCPHRACCNPNHLEDVAHRENVQRGEAGKKSAAWKTACIHKHDYTPENTYIDPTGHQRCRRCAANRYANSQNRGTA